MLVAYIVVLMIYGLKKVKLIKQINNNNNNYYYYYIIIIIIIINCNLVVTRWQWLFYMYTKHEIGY